MIDSNTQVRQKKEGKKKEKKMFRVRTTLISKQGALTCVPFPIKRKLEIRMTRPCIDLACLFFFSKLQRLTFFFPLYEKLWYINSSTRLEIEKVILFAKGFIFFFFCATVNSTSRGEVQNGIQSSRPVFFTDFWNKMDILLHRLL